MQLYAKTEKNLYAVYVMNDLQTGNFLRMDRRKRSQLLDTEVQARLDQLMSHTTRENKTSSNYVSRNLRDFKLDSDLLEKFESIRIGVYQMLF
jgi:hypothetical protein